MKASVRVRLIFCFFLFSFAIFSGPAVGQTTYVVDKWGGGDFTSIQACISDASSGDTCQVNAGTYLEIITLWGKDITLVSTSGPERTIIDGRGAATVVTFAYGVSEDAVIDGFTIRNGSVIDPYFPWGGGILCYYYASPQIRNCHIKGNTAILGAGIALIDSSSTITNCRMTGNTALSKGGGVFSGTYSDFSPTLENCLISGNTAQIGGGGVYFATTAKAITNCLITGNTAQGGSGGGLYCYGPAPITNTTISGNAAYGYGGGIYFQRSASVLENSIMWGNTAAEDPEIYIGAPASTDYDFATIKYDVDGNPLWIVRYNGPGNGRDEARSVVLDVAGNVYVSGTSDGEGTDGDYATVKYDPDGNELWTARYNGPGNDYDGMGSMANDDAGNVYVTGGSMSGSEYDSEDFATVKYDPDGNELWVARYNGPVNRRDWARSLAVDASGNVYVTGESYGDGTKTDYATVKYDPDGNELWVARYDGSGNDYDTPYSLAVDTSGNVYVTGGSYRSTDYESQDYATVKYDPDGNELWVARYNGPEDDEDWAVSIAVDAAGNVYVHGNSYDAWDEYYATVKYDPDGNMLWASRQKYGFGTCLALDSAANVHVSGGDWAIYTVKYDTDGNELWMAQYDDGEGGAGNLSERANSIAVDAAGYVYIAGRNHHDHETYDNYTTVKYAPDGTELWVASYNGPGSSGDTAESIAVNPAGQVYVTGRSYGSASITVAHSNVQGGWPGDGNISEDPAFVDPDGVDDLPGTLDDNYRLNPDSPCVDKGNNAAPGLPATDLDGKPRVANGDGDDVAVVDMGAYEYSTAPSPWGAASTVPGGSRFGSDLCNAFLLLLVPAFVVLVWRRGIHGMNRTE